MKCPRCKRIWEWDGCADTLVGKRKKQCLTADLKVENQDHVECMFCDCGKILAFSVSDEDGSDIYFHPLWADEEIGL